MEQMNWKKIASVFFGIMGIMILLISLFFNVYTCDVGERKIAVNGFDFITNAYYPDGLRSGDFMKIIIFVLFIVFLIETLMILVDFVSKKKLNKVIGLFLIVNFVLLTVYLINGFVFRSDIEKEFMEELGEDEWVSSFIKIEMKTFCFIPLIIHFFCVVAYLIVKNMGETNERETLVKDSAHTEQYSFKKVKKEESNCLREQSTVNEEKLELLLKCKRFLDEGVITKEEFDRKKQQLLW